MRLYISHGYNLGFSDLLELGYVKIVGNAAASYDAKAYFSRGSSLL